MNRGNVLVDKVARIPKNKGKYPGPYSKKMRRRFTDLRHREARELQEIIDEISNDLGEPNAGQKVLLANLKAKLAIVRGIVAWVERQEKLISDDGKLLGVLAQNFVTYSSAVQRGVMAIYELNGKKSGKTVDLESYIAGKKAAEGSGE